MSRPMPARRGALPLVAVLAALALLLPTVPAAAPDGSPADGPAAADGTTGPLRTATSAGPEGEVRVGEMVTFTYYVLDPGASAGTHSLLGHIDTDVTVEQDGETVLHLISPHEHDGVFHLDFRFTRPGDYAFTVETDDDRVDGEVLKARVEGTVLPAGDADPVELSLDGPSSTSAGMPAVYAVRALHAPEEGDAHLFEHVDLWVRLYRDLDDKLVQRAQLHLHDGEGAFEVNPLLPGDYTLRAELYPHGHHADHASFEPTSVTRALTVTPGAAARPTEVPALPGTGDGPGRLLLRVDPTTTVGPLADMKLNALYLDDDGNAVPHVDYTLELLDPLGNVVLRTEDAHRHDGAAELFAHTPVPGTYRFRAVAEPRTDEAPGGAGGGAEAAEAASFGRETAEATYTVVPPVAVRPTVPPVRVDDYLPGTVELVTDGAMTGMAHMTTLRFTTEAGTDMEHIEADLEMFRPGDDGVPVWTTKLHTHQRDVELAPLYLEPGAHYLKVNPSPQSPSAQVIATPAGFGAPLGFHLDVTGEEVPAPDAGPAGDGPADAGGETLPAPPMAAVAAALVVAALWVARRRHR